MSKILKAARDGLSGGGANLKHSRSRLDLTNVPRGSQEISTISGPVGRLGRTNKYKLPNGGSTLSKLPARNSAGGKAKDPFYFYLHPAPLYMCVRSHFHF